MVRHVRSGRQVRRAMDEEHIEERVICRRCRFRFPVDVSADDNWRVEAQCPSCESWACFTVADTKDPPPPGPAELEAERQRVAEVTEMLRRPLNENRDHPAVALIDRIGNGLFEDDYTPSPWPIPTFCVYRFKNGNEFAYIWQEGGYWFVRGWHPLRGQSDPPDVVAAFTFEAALNRLLE